MQAVERGAQSQASDQGDLWLKPGEAMRPKTATYVTLFDPKKLVNLMSMSDAKCETFHICICIYRYQYIDVYIQNQDFLGAF